MSNDSNYERLWKLQATANKLVLDGRRDPLLLCNLFQKFVEGGDIKTTSYLKLISDGHVLSLPATNGKRTIAQAGDVFTGGIDSNFRRWKLDVPSAPTAPMSVQVWEHTTNNGNFADIFASTGKPNDALCIPQSQIVFFAATYQEWLRTNGYRTFFMFKKGEEFFVPSVSFGDARQLHADVDRLSDDDVLPVVYRYRFVIPQLEV